MSEIGRAEIVEHARRTQKMNDPLRYNVFESSRQGGDIEKIIIILADGEE